MNVRFREPFYEGEEVTVAAGVRDGGVIAVTAGRASAEAGLGGEVGAVPEAHPVAAERGMPRRSEMQPGVRLGSFRMEIAETNERIVAALGDPLEVYRELAHPTVLLGLANEILVRNYVLPAWIHTASEVRNTRAARAADGVEVRGVIREAFEKKGHEFLVAEVAILSDKGDLLTWVRHTAIWQPRLVK